MKHSTLKLSMFVACLSIAAYANAASSNSQCVYLISDEKFEAAYMPCLEAAVQGDAAAQSSFADMYKNGTGVPQDYKKAAKWYQASADQGLAEAQLGLGILYFNGNGVPQNYKEAIKYYLLAADQGNTDAEYLLGNMYKNGIGVPQDYEQAIHWYRQAANQGLAIAQYNLGFMYVSGQGVDQDIDEAIKWYQLAAEQENTIALTRLGITSNSENLDRSDNFDSNRNDVLAQGAAQKAIKWERAAAEAYAQSSLGKAPVSEEQASKWYQLATEKGYPGDQYLLGIMFFRGLGVPQDKNRAADLINRVRTSNHPTMSIAAEDFWNKNYLSRYKR